MTHIKIILQRITSDIRQNRIPLLMLLAYMATTQFFFHKICPWLLLTGHPCPACGLTRASVLLLTFRFEDAWRMNPTVWLWIPFLLYLAICRYILGKKPALAMPLTIFVCCATIAVWLWRYPPGNYFNSFLKTFF